MYRILKNGALLSIEDELRPVAHNRNLIYIPCDLSKAEGIVIGNDYVEPIEGLEIQYVDGAAQLADMEAALTLLGYPDSLMEVSTYDV